MATSLEGVGSNLLGCRDLRPDGSFVATKFYCFFYLPIVPVSSWRVLPAPGSLQLPFVRRKFVWAKKLPMHWQQVISVYLAAGAVVGYGACFFEFAVPYLKTHTNLISGDWSEVFVFGVWMSLPWILVRQMRKRALERAREGVHHLNTPNPIG
jgi:hypothetical protein